MEKSFDVNAFLGQAPTPEEQTTSAAPAAEETTVVEEKEKVYTDPAEGKNYDEEDDWDDDDAASAEEAAPAAEPKDEELEAEELRAIETINKRLGTSYKSLDELNAARETAQAAIKEKKYLNEDEERTLNAVEYFLGQPPEVMIKAQLKADMQAMGLVEPVYDDEGNEKKNENGEPIMDVNEDDLEFNYQELKKDISRYAEMKRNLESNLLSRKKELADKKEQLKKADEQAAIETSTENRKKLTESLKKLNNFVGIEVDSLTRHKIYKNVVSGEFFQSLLQDQEKVAKAAMFLELERRVTEAKMDSALKEGKMAVFQRLFASKPTNSGRQVTNSVKGEFNPAGWLDN